MKSDYSQIPPHLPKIECDKLVEEDKIYGCGKPFQLVLIEGEWKPVICEYIWCHSYRVLVVLFFHW